MRTQNNIKLSGVWPLGLNLTQKPTDGPALSRAINDRRPRLALVPYRRTRHRYAAIAGNLADRIFKTRSRTNIEAPASHLANRLMGNFEHANLSAIGECRGRFGGEVWEYGRNILPPVWVGLLQNPIEQ